MNDPDTASFKHHRAVVERLVVTLMAAIERGKGDALIRPEIDARQTSSQRWGGWLGTVLIRIDSAGMTHRFQPPLDYNKSADGYIQLVCNGLRNKDPDAPAKEAKT